MNRSLAALVQELFQHPNFCQAFGAVHGLSGILGETFIDLRRQSKSMWDRIARTPGAALGSGRRSLKPQDVPLVLDILDRHNVGYLFFIGGNDSAETAHRIASAGRDAGQKTVVLHVPKTIDNDLEYTDHCPGYGSTARFVALATMGAGRDAESMGDASPITVLEVMGRDAGWLAASSVLGKRDRMDPPHFVCVPEVPVDEDTFLDRMEDSYRRWGYAVAVTAENARGRDGPIGGDLSPFHVDDFGHQYFQGPGQHLAHLLSEKLRVRVRSEKPGTIQRSLAACVSRADAGEAALVGRESVRYAAAGQHDCMVTLVRQPGAPYHCTTGTAPLSEVAGAVKRMPPTFFDPRSGLPTSEFIQYARPLVGAALPSFPRLPKLTKRGDKAPDPL